MRARERPRRNGNHVHLLAGSEWGKLACRWVVAWRCHGDWLGISRDGHRARAPSLAALVTHCDVPTFASSQGASKKLRQLRAKELVDG